MYRMVLLRHGQSEWNLSNQFSGWTNIDLTPQGEEEARASGRLMKEEGLMFEVVHTSVLLRSIRTADLALAEMGTARLPVLRHWRLNERHYGALQGLNKKQIAREHGAEQVHLWRRSYDVSPPPLDQDDPRHPRFDPVYADLAPEALPATECLKDVVARVLPYWRDRIVPQLRQGLTPLVVCHGNSIRALLKHLENISDEEISSLNIPTGIPLLYELDADLEPAGSRYLGDPAAAAAAAARVAAQAAIE